VCFKKANHNAACGSDGYRAGLLLIWWMQLEVRLKQMIFRKLKWVPLAAGLLMSVSASRSKDNGKRPSSYAPVDIHESFSAILSRMSAAKPEIMKRHMALLEQRYDLSDRPAQGVKMLPDSRRLNKYFFSSLRHADHLLP
jgi:hypothetical protein